MRVWSFIDNGAHLHASYLASLDGKVQVRRSDGKVISIEIAKLTAADQKWIETKVQQVRQLNENARTVMLAKFTARKAPSKPSIADSFDPFAKLNAIKYRQDAKFFYVESNSMPDHRMMVGITAWQQQVPLPQPYFGENAWRVPLEPVVAKNPLSAKSHFFRGAIALAANGIPIFNPIKNDGRTDTLIAGELDEFGGHCGRADDYHYHIAPTHLQEIVGKDKPVAYALDGYPIYGYTEPDGSKVVGLDAFNGHTSSELGYHYHATKTYPYLNGGFHGEVVERDGQVDPQPRAEGVRGALSPLRGAKITGFESKDNKSFSVKIVVGNETRYVNYVLNDNGSVKFDFVDGNGKVKSETYSPRQRGPGGRGGPQGGSGGGDRPPRNNPPRNDPARDNPPPRQEPPARNDPPRGKQPPEANSANMEKSESSGKKTGFTVFSSAIGADGRIPVEFTCDGKSASPPIQWKDAPAGTKSFALSLWHTAPDQEKSYWLVYNIPANVDHLDKNDKQTGIVGLNDKKKAAYDPMCSKGPGLKKYHVTVYALSSELKLAKGSDNRAAFLKAVKEAKLAETTLDFQYERKK
ncbi:MAG: YHYH protein [Planctomycetota bacterium]|nr:YHYH protein [Planctomycetota bacterium]